jgi:hypothetical protein
MNKKAEASNKYNKENTVTVLLRLNKKYDKDLISFLDQVKDHNMTVTGFIKEACRNYIRLYY